MALELYLLCLGRIAASVRLYICSVRIFFQHLLRVCQVGGLGITWVGIASVLCKWISCTQKALASGMNELRTFV